MKAKVKITVLKRTLHKELLEKYAESIWEPCERLCEGKEFVSEDVNIPPGLPYFASENFEGCLIRL